MKKMIENYLLDQDERGDEPTGRFVKSYSTPELEMQAEALKMCLDILGQVPEPGESTALIKWRMVRTELRCAYAEINVCDKENEARQRWESAPPKKWNNTQPGFPAVKAKKRRR